MIAFTDEFSFTVESLDASGSHDTMLRLLSMFKVTTSSENEMSTE